MPYLRHPANSGGDMHRDIVIARYGPASTLTTREIAPQW